MLQPVLPSLSRRAFIAASVVAGVGSMLHTLDSAAQAPIDQRPEPPGSAIVQVNAGQGPQYTQPAVAADPRDPRRLLAVCRKNAPTPKQPPVVAAFGSGDGGLTWRETAPLPLPVGLTIGTDATVSFDSSGVAYIAALVSDNPALTTCRIVVWHTGDGGHSFSSPVTVFDGAQIDHPWLAADPAASGHLHLAWARQVSGLMVSRSIDGGQTFEAPRSIVSPAGGSTVTPVVATGSGGLVLIAYGHTAPAARPATPDGISDLAPVSLAVVRSTDGGVHFGSGVVIGAMAPAVAPAAGNRIQTGPAIAIDTNSPRVYVTAASFNQATGQSAIQVAKSDDGGASFGQMAPVTGDAQPDATTYAQPNIVADAAGGVNVTYLAIDAAQPQIAYDVFLTRSTDQGATFSHRLRLSDRSRGFAVEGVDAAGLYHWLGGDYQGLTATDGTIHPMWTDPVSGIVTTAKTVAN